MGLLEFNVPEIVKVVPLPVIDVVLDVPGTVNVTTPSKTSWVRQILSCINPIWIFMMYFI